MNKFFDVVSNKPFKIFYHGLVPRSVRKSWRYKYDELPTQVAVAEYWQSIIREYQDGNIDRYQMKPKKDLNNRKVIWQYWAQGIENANDTAKLCFASVDRYKGDYEVIRITDDNLEDYLELPDFIAEKRKNSVFKPVFFSDLLRVALINVYGGIWLDASILLTETIPAQYSDYDFFMFSRDPNSVNKNWGTGDKHVYFSWRDTLKVKHLSSIIYGRAGSKLSSIMLDLLLHFWKTEEAIPHYFFFQIMINELREVGVVDFDFPVQDDTLPHLLQFKMKEKFDHSEFEAIKAQASLHKLSLHDTLKEKTLLGDLTYYGYLTQNQ